MSFVYTLPGTTSQPIDPQRAKARDRLFGRDIWFDVTRERIDRVVTAKGDWKLVDGVEALRQSLIRRIITNPGEWQTKPDYGVGARLFVKQRMTSTVIADLQTRIRSQMLKDARVDRVDQVIVERSNGVLHIVVTIVAKGRDINSSPINIGVDLE